MKRIGWGDAFGLEFIANGEEDQTIRPSNLICMINHRFDVIQGFFLKGRGKKILLIGPYPYILAVEEIRPVQRLKKLGP